VRLHPLVWLTLRNYRNVLRQRLRTLRSPSRAFALCLIVAGLVLVARQREAAETAVAMRTQTTSTSTGAGGADRAPKPSPTLRAIGRLRDEPDSVAFGMALLLLGFLAVAWLNPVHENPLEMTAAETATLLPAPLPRWQIVIYKVARWQLPLLLHSLVLTVVLSGTRDLGGSLRRAFAFWVLIAAWRTHRGFVGIARATLEAARLTALVRLVTAALAIGLFAVVWTHRDLTGDGDRLLDALEALPRWAADDGWRWPLLPLLALTTPIARSGDAEPWLFALPPALAVLALLVLTVVAADEAFQRASAGEARATDRPERAARTLLSLPPWGPRALALSYRQLAPHLRWSALAAPLGSALGVLVAGFALPRLGLTDASLLLTGLLVSFTCFFVLPFAPLIVRLDIRREMERIDSLRALPLPSTHVLAALAFAEWLACLVVQGTFVALLVANLVGRGIPFATIAPWLARLLPFWPLLTLLGVSACQLGALTFPTWVAPSNPRGPRIDAVGGRMLTLLGFGGGLGLLALPPYLAGSEIAKLVRASTGEGPLAALSFVASFATVTFAEAWLLLERARVAYEKLAIHDPTRGTSLAPPRTTTSLSRAPRRVGSGLRSSRPDLRRSRASSCRGGRSATTSSVRTTRGTRGRARASTRRESPAPSPDRAA
jgi:hypothetical protein